MANKYINLCWTNQIWSLDQLSGRPNLFITKIDKKPSIDICKNILWKVFEHHFCDQYIEKLSWEKDYSLIPELYIQHCDHETAIKISHIHNELKEILFKFWNLKS